jgi:hypothetical protein
MVGLFYLSILLNCVLAIPACMGFLRHLLIYSIAWIF